MSDLYFDILELRFGIKFSKELRKAIKERNELIDFHNLALELAKKGVISWEEYFKVREYVKNRGVIIG